MRAGRLIAIVLVAVIVAAALSACGGASHGLASKDPQAIVAAATRAIERVRSVHVSGVVDEDSPQELRFDLWLLRGRGAVGTVSERGLAVRMVTLGDIAYLKGSPAFWLQFGGASIAAQLHGRWLRAPADRGAFASLAPLTNPGALLARLLAGHGALSRGTTSTIAGRRVIAVHDSSRQGTLYVAMSGSAYPIRIVNGSSRGARIDFGGFDAPVSLRAPAHAVSAATLRG